MSICAGIHNCGSSARTAGKKGHSPSLGCIRRPAASNGASVNYHGLRATAAPLKNVRIKSFTRLLWLFDKNYTATTTAIRMRDVRGDKATATMMC